MPPLIQETYARFEAETDARQRRMEQRYLAVYESQPYYAAELLQSFSDQTLLKALQVTE